VAEVRRGEMQPAAAALEPGALCFVAGVVEVCTGVRSVRLVVLLLRARKAVELPEVVDGPAMRGEGVDAVLRGVTVPTVAAAAGVEEPPLVTGCGGGFVGVRRRDGDVAVARRL